MKQSLSVHKVVLSIHGKINLLFFLMFIGYIFKGTGGASVQWIGSLKKEKKKSKWKYVYFVATQLYLNNFSVHYRLEEES